MKTQMAGFDGLDIHAVQYDASGMNTNGIDVRTEHLLQLILQLSEPEQLLLVERVIALMRVRAQGDGGENGPARSLLELRGLGQEIWDGVDAQVYVNEERNSWRQ